MRRPGGPLARPRAWLLILLLLCPARSFCQEGPPSASAGAQPEAAPPDAPPTALALPDAERRALDWSPALKAAGARIQIEEGRLRQAGLYPNPDVSLDSTWLTRGAQNRETILNLRQPIAWPAFRDLLRREAMERIEAARHDRDRARLDVLLEVRGAYDRLYFAGAILKVENEDLEATRSLRKAAEARVAAGDAPPFEALKAAVEVSRAESDVERARGEVQAETASINLLLGFEAETPTTVVEPPADPGQTGDLPALLARALERQPEVRAAHHGAQAAALAAERALVERRPEVAIGPTLGTDHAESFAGAGVSLRLPLWNRNQGNIVSAASARDEARALLDVVRLTLSRQVAESFDRYLAARAQKQVFEQGLLETSARMLEKARQAYQGGETGILEFLDARRTALAVREEYLRASLDAALAAAQLRRAVGDDVEGTSP